MTPTSLKNDEFLVNFRWIFFLKKRPFLAKKRHFFAKNRCIQYKNYLVISMFDTNVKLSI